MTDYEWAVSGDSGYSVRGVADLATAGRVLKIMGPKARIYRRPATGASMKPLEQPKDGGWVEAPEPLYTVHYDDGLKAVFEHGLSKREAEIRCAEIAINLGRFAIYYSAEDDS